MVFAHCGSAKHRTYHTDCTKYCAPCKQAGHKQRSSKRPFRECSECKKSGHSARECRPTVPQHDESINISHDLHADRTDEYSRETSEPDATQSRTPSDVVRACSNKDDGLLATILRALWLRDTSNRQRQWLEFLRALQHSRVSADKRRLPVPRVQQLQGRRTFRTRVCAIHAFESCGKWHRRPYPKQMSRVHALRPVWPRSRGMSVHNGCRQRTPRRNRARLVGDDIDTNDALVSPCHVAAWTLRQLPVVHAQHYGPHMRRIPVGQVG